MLIEKKISKIRSIITKKKLSKQKIALVPTMGAIHDGHLALVKKAKKLADIVVVTIFVNKPQFNDLNDYLKYPNQIDADIKKLQAAKVDYLFLPQEDEVYPAGFSYKITPNSLTNCLCGSSRQGHFDGVSLIVAKLFNIITPDIAIFGQKDFQQLQIIKKLVKDLNFNVKIFGHKILRQKDGLALSSRNSRLSPKDLIKAAEIYHFLTSIRDQIISNSKQKIAFDLQNFLEQKKIELLNNSLNNGPDNRFEKIDYLEIRQEENLELIQKFNPKIASRIFIAVYLGKIRLIDNLKL
jgi:pantoate--beta-alanine ligase